MSMMDFVIWLVGSYMLVICLVACVGFVKRLVKRPPPISIDTGPYLPPKIMVERVGGGFDKIVN